MSECTCGRSRYLTTREAAEYCRFKSIDGIYSAVRRGQLRAYRRGGPTGDLVFEVSDLDAYIKRGEVVVAQRPQRSRRGRPTKDDPRAIAARVAEAIERIRAVAKRGPSSA